MPHARELARHPDTAAKAELLGWVARYDKERGDFRQARLGCQQAWDARLRLLGPEHPDTLTSMTNLAETLRVLGDRSALGNCTSRPWTPPGGWAQSIPTPSSR